MIPKFPRLVVTIIVGIPIFILEKPMFLGEILTSDGQNPRYFEYFSMCLEKSSAFFPIFGVVPGMGMPYMGYTPDGMMAPMAMPGPMGAMGTGGNTAATSSPQRNDLVAKAKTQRLGDIGF